MFDSCPEQLLFFWLPKKPTQQLQIRPALQPTNHHLNFTSIIIPILQYPTPLCFIHTDLTNVPLAETYELRAPRSKRLTTSAELPLTTYRRYRDVKYRWQKIKTDKLLWSHPTPRRILKRVLTKKPTPIALRPKLTTPSNRTTVLKSQAARGLSKKLQRYKKITAPLTYVQMKNQKKKAWKASPRKKLALAYRYQKTNKRFRAFKYKEELYANLIKLYHPTTITGQSHQWSLRKLIQGTTRLDHRIVKGPRRSKLKRKLVIQEEHLVDFKKATADGYKSRNFSLNNQQRPSRRALHKYTHLVSGWVKWDKPQTTNLPYQPKHAYPNQFNTLTSSGQTTGTKNIQEVCFTDSSSEEETTITELTPVPTGYSIAVTDLMVPKKRHRPDNFPTAALTALNYERLVAGIMIPIEELPEDEEDLLESAIEYLRTATPKLQKKQPWTMRWHISGSKKLKHQAPTRRLDESALKVRSIDLPNNITALTKPMTKNPKSAQWRGLKHLNGLSKLQSWKVKYSQKHGTGPLKKILNYGNKWSYTKNTYKANHMFNFRTKQLLTRTLTKTTKTPQTPYLAESDEEDTEEQTTPTLTNSMFENADFRQIWKNSTEWPDDDLNDNLYGLQQDFEPQPQMLFRAPLTPYLITEVQPAPINPTNGRHFAKPKNTKNTQTRRKAHPIAAPKHIIKKTKQLCRLKPKQLPILKKNPRAEISLQAYDCIGYGRGKLRKGQLYYMKGLSDKETTKLSRNQTKIKKEPLYKLTKLITARDIISLRIAPYAETAVKAPAYSQSFHYVKKVMRKKPDLVVMRKRLLCAYKMCKTSIRNPADTPTNKQTLLPGFEAKATGVNGRARLGIAESNILKWKTLQNTKRMTKNPYISLKKIYHFLGPVAKVIPKNPLPQQVHLERTINKPAELLLSIPKTYEAYNMKLIKQHKLWTRRPQALKLAPKKKNLKKSKLQRGVRKKCSYLKCQVGKTKTPKTATSVISRLQKYYHILNTKAQTSTALFNKKTQPSNLKYTDRAAYYHITSFKNTITLAIQNVCNNLPNFKNIARSIRVYYNECSRKGLGLTRPHEFINALALTILLKETDHWAAFLAKTIKRLSFSQQRRFLRGLKLFFRQLNTTTWKYQYVLGFYFKFKGAIGTKGGSRKKTYIFSYGKIMHTTNKVNYYLHARLLWNRAGAVGLKTILVSAK